LYLAFVASVSFLAMAVAVIALLVRRNKKRSEFPLPL
jgi:hypothetical protein